MEKITNKFFTILILFLLAFPIIAAKEQIDKQIVKYTDYFTVQEVQLDKSEYHPCEEVVVTILRDSKVNDANAIGLREIILLKADGTVREVDKKQFFPGLEKGSRLIQGSIALPCNFDPGLYEIVYIINYTYESIPKSYSFSTPKFTVTRL